MREDVLVAFGSGEQSVPVSRSAITWNGYLDFQPEG
jgi:hypothetical protein